jgi:preprotein translocase subunit SecA
VSSQAAAAPAELGGGSLPGFGKARTAPRNLTFNNPSEASSSFAQAERPEAHGGGDSVQTVRREGKKVGRNDPCPCGSGKKYKKCHGVN